MSGYLQKQNVHVDKHLSNVAINYRPTGFVGDRIFPIVPVRYSTDMIKTYNQADLFRQERTLRSPGAEANKIDVQVGSLSYVCKNYATATDITMEERVNSDPAFLRDLEQGRVMRMTDALNLDWDRRIAAQVTNASNVGTSSNVASAWTDYSNSTPLNDCWEVMDQIEDATGYRPNRAIFAGDAWRNFARNNTVIDKVRSTGISGGGMNATVQDAASLLQLEEVNVGFAYYNTAEEGQSQSLSRIWGDHVLLYYAPSRPSLELPSFGYTFRQVAAGLPNMQVERIPFDRKTGTDMLQMGYYQDELITAQPLGGLVMHTTSSQ